MQSDAWKIMQLLDSGEWGEITPSIEKLREAGRLLREAEVAFTDAFETAERDRKDVVQKRFMTLKVGYCQVHGRYNGDEGLKVVFPLDQLKIVQTDDHPRLGIIKCIMCKDCLSRADRPRPRLWKVGDSPTPEQYWKMAEDSEIRRLASHFKMPCLRYY